MRTTGRGNTVSRRNAAGRVSLIVGGLAVFSVTLTGCLQGPGGSSATPSHGSTSASPSATTTSAPSGTPSASPSPTPSGGAVTTTCDRVLTANQVYAYNPNVVADDAYSPAPGSIAASMKANSGLACGWVNETSRVELEVALSLPTPAQLASAKSAAAQGTAVPSSGTDAAYFSVSGGVGRVQLFQGSYWIEVASADFAAYGDATPVYDSVVKNLRTAGG